MAEDEGPDEESSADGRFICPECGDRFGTPRGLGRHRSLKHGVPGQKASRAQAQQRTARTDEGARPSVNLAAENDRLVESLSLAGIYLSVVLPHTGVTLISRTPDRQVVMAEGAEPIRKRGIASVVMEYAAQDPRVLRAVVRFNNLMHAGDALELAMSLAAAVAVDVHAVPAHLEIPMPGMPGMSVRPVEALIGDVIEKVEAQFPGREEEPAEAGETAA